jgi:hypothetical protein
MKKWLLLIFASLLLNVTNVYSEEPLEFAKRYISEINQNSTPEAYSKYWREKVRTHLHNTELKLRQELNSSVKMHELFLTNGSLDVKPKTFEMQKNVISYTFQLKFPIRVRAADPVALLYPKWIYKEFQITVEEEHGAWKIAGETFVGEED